MSEVKKYQDVVCDKAETIEVELPPCKEDAKKEEIKTRIFLPEIAKTQDPDVKIILFNGVSVDIDDEPLDFNNENITRDFSELGNLFKEYVKFQKMLLFTQGSRLTLNGKKFYIRKEGIRILRFANQLKRAIRKNFTRRNSGVSLGDLADLQISIKNNKITSITVNKKGCEPVALKGISKLLRTPKTTVMLVDNIKKNLSYVKGIGATTNWLDALKKLTNNKIEIKPLVKRDMSFLKDEVFEDLRDRLLDEEFSLSDCIQFSISNRKMKSKSKHWDRELTRKTRDLFAGNISEQEYSLNSGGTILSKGRLKKVFNEMLKPKKLNLIFDELRRILEETDDIRDINLSGFLNKNFLKSMNLDGLRNILAFLDFRDAVEVIFKKIIESKPESIDMVLDGLGGDVKKQIWEELKKRLKTISLCQVGSFAIDKLVNTLLDQIPIDQLASEVMEKSFVCSVQFPDPEGIINNTKSEIKSLIISKIRDEVEKVDICELSELNLKDPIVDLRFEIEDLIREKVEGFKVFDVECPITIEEIKELLENFGDIVDNLSVDSIQDLLPDINILPGGEGDGLGGGFPFPRPWDKGSREQRNKTGNFKKRGEFLDSFGGQPLPTPQEIYKAYGQAFFAILNFDTIIDKLNVLPGGSFFKNLLSGGFSLNGDNIFGNIKNLPNFLKLDLMQFDVDFILPSIPQLPNFTSGGWAFILEKLKKLAIRKLLDIANSLVISLLLKLLDALEASIDKLIQNLANRALSAIGLGGGPEGSQPALSPPGSQTTGTSSLFGTGGGSSSGYPISQDNEGIVIDVPFESRPVRSGTGYTRAPNTTSTGGSPFLNQDNKKNPFRKMVNQIICDNNLEGSEATQENILENSGIPRDKMREFIDFIGENLNSFEFTNLILEPDSPSSRKIHEKLLNKIRTMNIGLSDIFEDVDDFSSIFSSIRDLMTDEETERLRSLEILESRYNPGINIPLTNSICLDNEKKEILNNLRDQVYGPGAGRSETEKDKQRLSDLLDPLLDDDFNGIMDKIKDALKPAIDENTGLIKDPECVDDLPDPESDEEDDNILPIVTIDEEMNQILNQGLNTTFEDLNKVFELDMIGRRNSFFDNVLTDQRGIKLSSGFLNHERRVSLRFLFPNAANTVAQNENKYEEAGFFEKYLMRTLTEDEDAEGNKIARGDKPYPNHLFPQTIGIHCKNQLEETMDDFDFDVEEDNRLKFRNKTDLKDAEFDYGFNIVYKPFIKENNAFTRSGFCRVKKVDITLNKKVLGSKTVQSKIVDVNFKSKLEIKKYPKIIEALDPKKEKLTEPYQANLFKKFLKKKSGLNLNVKKGVFNKLKKKINKKISKRLLKVATVEDPPIGFKFGYIDDELNYEDLLYVSPDSKKGNESTWKYDHKEKDEILGVSATRHPRVKFLDPMKYGGKYTKPKIYIEDIEHDGWLGFMGNVVPEEDGADPKRESFLFVSEISEKVNKKQTKIPNDERMDIDPDCFDEPPFDKLMESGQKAQMEGVVTTTIRTYVIESILRCLPIFSVLAPDFDKNYSDLYLDFIVAKMQDDMMDREEWPSRIRGNKYWHLFLDSCVDLSFRLVQEKELDPDPRLLELLKEANEVSENYTSPKVIDRKILFKVKSYKISDGKITDLEFRRNLEVSGRKKQYIINIIEAMFYATYGSRYRSFLRKKKNKKLTWNLRFKKALSVKYLKKITREYESYKFRKKSKQILMFLIKKEFRVYSKKLKTAMRKKPEIEDITASVLKDMKIFLNDRESVFDISNGTSNNPLEGLALDSEGFQDLQDTGGLFIEKYFVADPKKGTRLSGVKSIKETRRFFKDYRNKEKYVSEMFGDAKVVNKKLQGSLGLKFGVRICYVPPVGMIGGTPAKSKYNKSRAFNVKSATISVDGSNKTHAPSKKYFPLISYEQDILDRKVKEFDLSDDNLGEDIQCYLDKLLESDDLDFLFNGLLGARNTASLIAIYYYDGFIESIGIDDTEREEGIVGTRGRWKETIMKRTRELLADMFSASYYSYDDQFSFENREISIKARKLLNRSKSPKLRKNFSKNVKRKQIRRLIDRPYDMFGNEKISVISDLLGD